MDWKHYNVHWKLDSGQKGKTCVTALAKEDAKTVFENYAKVDMPERRNTYPFEAKVVKVIGPLGMHQRTSKQHLAQMYRMCIGAAAMADKALHSIDGAIHNNPVQKEQIDRAWALAKAQSAKLQRDIRDLFKRAGLNVK